MASEGDGDSFVTRPEPASLAVVACADVPRLDLVGRLANDWLVPSSLPFVMRERAEGIVGAQHLLRTVSTSEIPEWSGILSEACIAFTGPDARSAAPPVRTEIPAHPNGPPPDGVYERRILNEMKERAGLAEGLSTFVIRYGPLAPGQRSASSFPEDDVTS